MSQHLLPSKAYRKTKRVIEKVSQELGISALKEPSRVRTQALVWFAFLFLNLHLSFCSPSVVAIDLNRCLNYAYLPSYMLTYILIFTLLPRNQGLTPCSYVMEVLI